MLRIRLILGLLVCFSLILGGCQPTVPGAPGAPAEQKVKLTVVMPSNVESFREGEDENNNEMEDDYAWSFTTEPDTDPPIAVISSPGEGDTIQGEITIYGTAWDRNFGHYQLSYGEGASPAQWTAITGQITTSVTGGALGTWDTAGVPGGQYTIRLEAVDAPPASNASEDAVLVTVGGEAPDPPTGVDATDGVYPDKVRITWNPSAGATSYEVWRNTRDNVPLLEHFNNNLMNLLM